MNEALPCNYRFLAQYNRWINQRLYGACSTLSDEERKRDRGAFFGSLHRTLNHLVLTDQMWMQRFMRCGLEHGVTLAGLEAAGLELPAGSQLDTVLFDDWAALCARREQLDEAINAWVAGMPERYPLSTMRYSNTKGVPRAHPAWQAMTHFFNHQTHHRGQVTVLLTQAGVDVGVTDLIALAGVDFAT